MGSVDGTIAPASSMEIAQANASNARTIESLRPAPVAGNVSAISSKQRSSRAENISEMRNTESQIQDALNRLRAHARTPKNLNFRLDQVSNRWMVTVRDECTGKVVREVPGDAVLKVAHNIESLKGVLFDQVL